jgi:hypothetical protein
VKAVKAVRTIVSVPQSTSIKNRQTFILAMRELNGLVLLLFLLNFIVLSVIVLVGVAADVTAVLVVGKTRIHHTRIVN